MKYTSKDIETWRKYALMCNFIMAFIATLEIGWGDEVGENNERFKSGK